MHHQQYAHQQVPLPQPHHQHPYQQPMHPDMEMHHQYSQHHLPHSQPYGPPPGARGPSHVRTHSRSSSGSYPQHVPYPVPHHEIAPPGFQGPVPGAPPPSMVAQPDSIISDPRHVPRYSSSQPVSGGYHVPPPHAMGNSSDPSAWQAPAPYGVAEPHLHQRPAHHPHPYHASSHTRPHSRSHSRTHSHSQPQQQQYAPHQTIQSPPSPRHATPPGLPHRYVQDTYVERAEPIRFPAPVPHPSNIVSMADDEDEQESDLSTVAGEQQGPVEDEQADASKCPDCGKVYKHATSLMKHRWEHSVYWKPAAKFLLSKHQQVQLMEAAAILLGMDETRDPDRDPIVCMFSKQRGVLATGTSTSAASPSSSSKSLSASPPPPAERGLAMKEESLMTPPASISYHGRVSSTTRHSVASTTSTASSLTSTPPSLAPDDESVAEVEDDGSMAPPPFRHHPQHPQQLQHHHHHHNQHHPMMMGMDMGPDQKHVEPEYYPHDGRYPSYHHPQQYAPYYHNQH